MTRVGAALLAAVTIAGGLAAGVLSAAPAGAAVPPGFTDELVTGVAAPTALAFAPDGRMLITLQSGAVRVLQGGSLLPAPALDLSGRICSNSERGLLGVAVDPAFAVNGYVFLYYSANKGICGSDTVNRVSRFVMAGNTLVGEVVLIDNIPSPAGNHNAGDVQFGKDGMLYVSVGDGGCDYPGGTPSGCGGANDASRDRHQLLGKVLRVDRNGGIPVDNPFTGPGTARCNTGGIAAGLICQETFSWGLRNPFRIASDPNAARRRLFVNDVGQSAWEEIDLAVAGADFGWNVREGNCATGSTTDCGPPPAGMTNPIFAYGRNGGCGSITGGAFVPNGVWPSDFNGRYLFADYVCGRIFRLDPNGSGGFNRVDFATGLGNGSAVHLTFGPWNGSQALYYTTYAGGGQVRRIVNTAINTPPAASVSGPGTFRVGETITVTGDATDAQDPTLSDSAFVWTVLHHHGAHTHLWASGTGRSFSFPAPTPEDLLAATNSYVDVILTVTDSGGLSSTAAMVIQPRKVQLTVATSPSGLQVLVEGTSFTAPATFTSWEGWAVMLEAPTPQNSRAFLRWSDTGARSHTVVTPATATTFTAIFSRPSR